MDELATSRLNLLIRSSVTAAPMRSRVVLLRYADHAVSRGHAYVSS